MQSIEGRNLIDLLVGPEVVDSVQSRCDAVVLAQPDRVHRCQSRLFVAAIIARHETQVSRLGPTVALLEPLRKPFLQTVRPLCEVQLACKKE